MKIAYITAGAAEMYCGSCLRDNTLAAALIARGHECLLIPTYTPVRTDEPNVSVGRVFFGGINVYLQQKTRLFRRMPALLDRVLSSPMLLRWVSRFAVKTRPEDLGELTISMLKGMDGYQRREVKKLVDWLSGDVKPEIVCLTNAILSGIVPELKSRLGVPVLCSLQGEDIFLDWLPAEFKGPAMAFVRENCRHIDGFITTSRYYADAMIPYLDLPRERVHVVYPGISLAGYPFSSNPGSINEGPELIIGYLARICKEKGLHILVDAVALLQNKNVPCRLKVAGYLGDRDRPYLEEQRKKARQEGWGNRFEYVGEVDHAGKIRFLQELDVFAVPTVYKEPKGLYVLEAWAAGVPVVQPRHGSFPELIETGGGGLTVNPEDPADLAAGLLRLLEDQSLRQQLGKAGQECVRRFFHADRMAEETLGVFRQYLGQQGKRPCL